MRKKTTRELLKKIAAVPCLYRHEESGAYYGIKKVEGRILSHALKVESGQNITDRKVAERALRAWIDGLTEPKRYAKNLPRGERHAALSGDAGVTKRIPTNVAASVRQRLYNLAKERQEDFNFVLGRFVAERLALPLERFGARQRFRAQGRTAFPALVGSSIPSDSGVDLLGYPVSVHQTLRRSPVRRSRSA